MTSWVAYAILLDGAQGIWSGQTWLGRHNADKQLRKLGRPGVVIRLRIEAEPS